MSWLSGSVARATRQDERRRPLAAEQLADLLNDGPFVGEFARLQLRVDQLSVDGNFKTTATGRF